MACLYSMLHISIKKERRKEGNTDRQEERKKKEREKKEKKERKERKKERITTMI